METNNSILVKECKSEFATRPILYTDSVNGKQAFRDDLWAITTEELNRLHEDACRYRWLRDKKPTSWEIRYWRGYWACSTDTSGSALDIAIDGELLKDSLKR